MKIMLDERNLNVLLSDKKELIGKTVSIDSVLSALSFLISVFFASYENRFGISGTIWKLFFCGLGAAFTLKVLWDLYKSKKFNYTHKNLMEDISKLNKIEHRHSIVVIKDTFNKFSNRYLVYDDKRWGCKFFINYATNPKDNEKFIKNHLSSDLKVQVDTIDIKYVTEQTNEKFSVSNNRPKTYTHTFYLVKIDNMPEEIKKDSFEIDSKKYYWKNITDLENDSDVIEKNSDVLNVVKSNF